MTSGWPLINQSLQLPLALTAYRSDTKKEQQELQLVSARTRNRAGLGGWGREDKPLQLVFRPDWCCRLHLCVFYGRSSSSQTQTALNAGQQQQLVGSARPWKLLCSWVTVLSKPTRDRWNHQVNKLSTLRAAVARVCECVCVLCVCQKKHQTSSSCAVSWSFFLLQ